MKLLIVGNEQDRTLIMDGLIPCVARIRNGEVVEIERRDDTGILIEKWLTAARYNPIARKQILKFVEKIERQRGPKRDVLSELQEKGRIILSGVV